MDKYECRKIDRWTNDKLAHKPILGIYCDDNLATVDQHIR